ncbi:MAG: hypothetical protein IKP46_05195 [Bacteroidales bacterium]|nr:hypothetical protein [Bacteroidales bacterium]
MNKKAFILLGLSVAALLASCKKGDDRPVRSDYIKVYQTSAAKTLDNILIPFEGATDGQIHVLSNVPLQWKYLAGQDAADNDWFTIKSVEQPEQGHWVVTYDAASLLSLNSLSRREGRLSFVCPEASFGKFMSVHQGYKRQFLDEFSDEPDQTVCLTGNQTYTTEEYSVLAADYYDYISFNAWAVTENEFLSKNITLDITISGGLFYDINRSTYRVNVPIGTSADMSNLQYLLIMGEGERMSAKTYFSFSVNNDADVYVHIDNLAAYQVTPADMGELFEDEDFDEDGGEEDWV